jgi:hypothetical protein
MLSNGFDELGKSIGDLEFTGIVSALPSVLMGMGMMISSIGSITAGFKNTRAAALTVASSIDTMTVSQ